MTSTDAVANALANPLTALPSMDFVGPTADDDIRRAISRYGPEAVKEAVKRQAKAKVGRPNVNDWKELRVFIEKDAAIWLDGGDPFTARSNYSIAKAIADENPGHSHPATMKRIQRKLKKRRWFTLVTAWINSENSYSYCAYIRTLRELCEMDQQGAWQWHLQRAEGSIADYAAKRGEPADTLTMAEVEAGAREPLNALLGMERWPQKPGGLFGLLTPPQGNALVGLGARLAENLEAGE